MISDTVYIATSESGVRVIEYSTSTDSSGISVTIGSNTQWSTGNSLTSNTISQLQVVDSLLLISTIGGGVNRYDISSDSWLATWSTNNWLSSNVVRGMALTDGWLHILAGSTVHAYDTEALLFRSQRQITDMGLVGTANSIVAWPAVEPRGPSTGMMMVGDG